MRDHVFLYLNGQPVRVTGDALFEPLSTFLRDRRRLTGTKVVCAEGDCGSCTVLVGRLRDKSLVYSPICSCIQLVFQLDGAHVVTIEGLKHDGELNPLQESFVKCHGAQCGFCTPGFVVSAYDLLTCGKPCGPYEVTRGLVGNLCRCTGYESIARAVLETDQSNLRPIDVLYPPGPIVAALQSAAAEPVEATAGDRRFLKPTTIEQAVQFRAAHPTSAIVSGATDIGVQVNKHIRTLTTVLTTGGIAGLGSVTREGNTLRVGATATLSQLESAAMEHLPELGRFLAWFGSPLIKNAGTLAGNLMNASPIGDTLPALMVLEAEVELTGPAGSRRVNLNAFYTGYRKTVLAADELLTAVYIPIPPARETFRLFKVSRRKDLDISTFGAAIRTTISAGVVQEIRIAFGGVAATVVRLPKTEAFLTGAPATLETFATAGDIARKEVTPISDVRGSSTYRDLLAANILTKFWHESEQRAAFVAEMAT